MDKWIISAHGGTVQGVSSDTITLPAGVEVVTFIRPNATLSNTRGWALFLRLLAGEEGWCVGWKFRGYDKWCTNYRAFGTTDFPSGIYRVGRDAVNARNALAAVPAAPDGGVEMPLNPAQNNTHHWGGLDQAIAAQRRQWIEAVG